MKNRRKNPIPLPCLRLHPCYVLVLLAIAGVDSHASGNSAPARVAEVQFNDQFLLRGAGPTIDLSLYNQGQTAAPGSYRADLYVNERWLGRAQVTLRQIGDDPRNVQTCFNRELLERMGVDLQKLSPEATELLVGAGDCPTLAQLVPDATASFDTGEQRLNTSVPQVSLSRSAQGYVDPRYWDDGVPAALLQYNANFYRSTSQGQSFSQGYTGLTGGLNVGPWRLRHSGSLSTASGYGMHYQSMQTNLQRSIPTLRSQLLVGDAFTDGSLFDSFGFRGVQLSSDDRMLPQSQRGYAPRVTGIARSNAVVRVRQNGNIIYETNVAPGAFSIDDLYPTGYGGNLDVEVTEADGSVHVSSVPYAAAVNALRPGISRYGVTIGRFRDSQIHAEPLVAQATVQHGFTNLVTGYGGIVAAQGYAAGLAGVALNTDWGAVGLDATQSKADLGALGSRAGQSVRLSYSKLVAPTNTNITVAAYRYSSSGYLNLRDAMALRHGESAYRGAFLRSGIVQNGFLQNGSLRGRLQVAINQQLPRDWGSVYVSGSSQDYWNRKGRDTQFQAGYSTNFGRVSAGVSVARQFDATLGRWDNVAMLNVGIPIGVGSQRLYTSTNIQHDFNGRSSVQETVTGSAGKDNAVSFGVNAMRATDDASGTRTSVGGNVAYASPIATLQANASRGQGFSQMGAGLSGGVVAFGGGVVFTPTLGETTAVIEADKAAGARVTNASGVRVDRWGHAVVPNLTPFASNEIELDPKGLPLSVELKTTAQHVAPTAGAVVKLVFETAGGGSSVLVRATMADGSPVPFGARATDSEGQAIGTVAQFGQLLVRGAEPGKHEYLVSWGDGAASQCRLPVTLAPPAKEDAGQAWTTVDAQCGATDQQVQ
ncbi:fimbria/pilus outer membrane usher protein [Achromobacter pestifer]|uniref:Outer membrane usher protein HtrE n=1 Tax=Achromobacter pestifer TaxID=1353889 RepID=A0A6S6Z221_9BURK|nr:fimbria/pilus outer membrane usher protein [Achromobacter pestifer]CAB3653877.1 Outer membrane usher protein HtrE [Achromobacter pestifer]